MGKTKSSGSRDSLRCRFQPRVVTPIRSKWSIPEVHPRSTDLVRSEGEVLDCAAYGQVDPERAGKAVEILSNLDTCQDGREFIDLLG